MRKVIEFTKSIILVLLALSILLLWTQYISLQFDKTGDAATPTLDNDFWIFTDGTHAPLDTALDSAYLSPVAVSILISGNGYTSAFNEELTHALYQNYIPLMNEVFSAYYKCESTTFDAWQKALDSPDSVLIEYPSALPYTTISLFSGKDDNFCTGEICFVEKLLLFSDETNKLTAISVDNLGNVYSFTQEDEEHQSIIYDFNSNNLAAYTINKGLIPFDFNGKTENIKNIPYEYKLLKDSPKLQKISGENPFSSITENVFSTPEVPYLELVSEENLAFLLDAFEVNPNIVRYYSDTVNGMVFVGTEMHLVLSPEGEVEYSVTDEDTNVPITSASILNTERINFTTDEILTAATSFLSKFPREILGGDARLFLKNISYSSDTEEFTYSFGYYYSLAEITGKKLGDDIVLVFNSRGLIEATIRPITFTPTDDASNTSSSLSSSILPSFAASIADGDSVVLSPVYEFKALGDAIEPVWATSKREGKKQ